LPPELKKAGYTMESLAALSTEQFEAEMTRLGVDLGPLEDGKEPGSNDEESDDEGFEGSDDEEGDDDVSLPNNPKELERVLEQV
jgi:hypothetical protein